MKGIQIRKKLGVVITVICLVCVSALAGCKKSDEVEGKVKDLEFTVVGQNEIPQELAEIIGQKKSASFRLTFSSGQDLYIAAGYGEQKTGGYSITVPECFLTDNSIVLKTELKGPEKGEQTGTEVSFPYIVIKMEFIEKPVVFK